ncbi:hypothetical protein EPO66_02370 [bacterium]|nr:MAG: hypothetical protein EPO66_02370 [bacterium]
MKRTLLALGVIFAVISGGCGYTTRSMISNKYRTIYITPFVNKIDITRDTDVANRYKINRPMIETDITKSVVNKYLFDGNLKPIKQEDADLTLKGEVVEFRRDPLRYTDNDDIEEYRLNLVVNIQLWDNKENKLLWEENGFTGDTTYYTSFHAVASEVKTESVAVNDAITDLSRRIVERSVEQW